MVGSVHVLAITVDGFEFGVLLFSILILVGAVLVIPAALFRRWYFYRRRLKRNIITAEYDPPLGLRPAEVGYIFDGKIGEREFAATIIDLVQRGVLVVKKTSFGKKELRLGPKQEKLNHYEKNILVQILSSNGIEFSALSGKIVKYEESGTHFWSKNRTKFAWEVHGSLQKRGYVHGNIAGHFLAASLKIHLLLVVVVLYVPLCLIWALDVQKTGNADLALLFGLLLFGFVLSMLFFIPLHIAAIAINYFRGRITGREWIITPKLKKMWPQLIGYRQYIGLVENERLEFQSVKLSQMAKNDTLPYAVALGFVKNWRDLLS